ncbi:hypothetical protein [Pseudothauera rhizosphaerae]|nr:hypothetical protein [Pseudothauera rhizosphaerae]
MHNWLNAIICRWTRHRWRFVRINAEGEKVFECRRCGRHFIAPRR